METRILGKRILLVEDEPGVRECIKRVLFLDYHTVTEAENGLEAAELFAQTSFDLVITDFDMPKMAGDQLAANIRSRVPSQPIIMITACADRLRGRHNPVDAILTKPFGIEELRKTITKLLS